MGWQRQDHGPSVQASVERAAFQMTGETVTAHAAGRTDRSLPGGCDLVVEQTVAALRLV